MKHEDRRERQTSTRTREIEGPQRQLRQSPFGMEYLAQYNAALDSIAEAGYDVEEFRFKGKSQSYGGSERYVDGRMLMVHMDTVLGYFELIETPPDETPPDKPEIGFRGPKKT